LEVIPGTQRSPCYRDVKPCRGVEFCTTYFVASAQESVSARGPDKTSVRCIRSTVVGRSELSEERQKIFDALMEQYKKMSK
jgi:hypothetical protein